LINTKTVYDNIAFVMKVVGKSHSEIARRVPETLEMVGLSDRANSYPAHLSGGEKQRVGIARALANNPLILLCDEPTSALDLENTNAILRLIKDININTGITTVIISHEMHVIKKICKRVAVMSQGKVIELDEVFNIFTAPKQDFTRQIVSQTLDIDFPAHSTLRTDSKTLKLIYSGERASDAVISDTIVFFNVKINILLGKIEYIADKPYGVLIVEITGSTEQLDASERYLREHTYKVENVEKGTI
ncbi:MAG: ATP-binding cassette domain-containing protein, partial [Tannerella sp.]|nr:ATP-binding cassette domain-containing protein [Tannerella sp.]